MQQIEHRDGRSTAERQRVEAIVETLANLRNQGETVAEVAHDARNMVTALGLYCDLLEEPGVLAASFSHYGSELRLVAAASRRLVEKLVELDQRGTANDQSREASLLPASPFSGQLGTIGAASPVLCSPALSSPALSSPALISLSSNSKSDAKPHPQSPSGRNLLWDLMPAEPIDNLAAELLANRNLLSSLAGTAITVTTDTDGGARRVRLTGEDLTRVLINLVKNACDALRSGGRIQIRLREKFKHDAIWLAVAVEDNGPGIPEENLERIFASGFTAPAAGAAPNGSWPSTHRGLGLAITRSIVESAGGTITAANRPQGGACLTIELPVRW